MKNIIKISINTKMHENGMETRNGYVKRMKFEIDVCKKQKQIAKAVASEV